MIRLKITKQNEEHLLLEALEQPANVGGHSILDDLKPEEIECDEFSKNALLKARFQAGSPGIRVWKNNRISWRCLNTILITPVADISKRHLAHLWLYKIKTSEIS